MPNLRIEVSVINDALQRKRTKRWTLGEGLSFTVARKDRLGQWIKSAVDAFTADTQTDESEEL